MDATKTSVDYDHTQRSGTIEKEKKSTSIFYI